jgi:phasin family protein
MFKNIEDFQKFGKDQFDAATKTAALLSKSAQQIVTEQTDYSKKAIELGTATVEKLMNAKSLDKAFEIQTDYAKHAYEGFVAQSTKLGDLLANLAKETFKPLEASFAKATAVAK